MTHDDDSSEDSSEDSENSEDSSGSDSESSTDEQPAIVDKHGPSSDADQLAQFYATSDRPDHREVACVIM